jgi:Ca2+/Na+ antiporter
VRKLPATRRYTEAKTTPCRFFQASLEKISDVLHLTPDVAGATFLAAGSSAPELFTSLADAFGPSNSIGMGTIVG